jgi:uncharacterized protein YqhQ
MSVRISCVIRCYGEERSKMKKLQNVGGQAVIEGVMMKNQNTYAVCVRNSKKEIITDIKEYVSMTKKYKLLGIPFVRGIVAFGESMVLGMKILTYSAEFFEVEDMEESKFDQWVNKKFGEKSNDILIGISVVLAIIMAVGLFVLLPLGLSQLLKPLLPSARWINFSDGIIRVIVLLAYVTLISKMKDIQRVFQYHGAEHKSINCYEAGLELTVENAKKQTRLHKRCGTSFLLYIVVISVFVLTLINAQTILMRFIVRIVMLPVIAGISYEVLKLLGKSNSPVLSIFTKPGLMLQKLTTQEPDDEQLEVALTALKSVLVIE